MLLLLLSKSHISHLKLKRYIRSRLPQFPRKPYPIPDPKWAKFIPVFRPKRRTTTRWVGTYLYSLYRGVPPGGFMFTAIWIMAMTTSILRLGCLYFKGKYTFCFITRIFFYSLNNVSTCSPKFLLLKSLSQTLFQASSDPKISGSGDVGSVRSEYSGPPLKMVQFGQSGHRWV